MKYHLYDVNHELIKYWNNQNYIDSLRFLSVFLCKKIDYLTGSQSIIEYADQFDEKGNFIVEIKECTISGNNETRDYINASCLNIDTVNFVTSMVKEAKGKGVEILIVAPPTLRESKVDAEKIDEAYQSISEKHVPCIFRKQKIICLRENTWRIQFGTVICMEGRRTQNS